jgi:hypothetical protein
MMANPSSRWDFVPVWGVYLNPVTDAASAGEVTFALSSRITRVDGRLIYPDGATVRVAIGDSTGQDSTVREAVRAAWRAADSALPGFDGSAWDVWWSDTVVPAAIFTRFPASDDPDIVQSGWSVTVSEALASARGKSYSITTLLAQLDSTIPGINLGAIEVPPGSPTVPAPMYAKGVAGGVAALDADGDVVDAAGVKVGGGSGSSTVDGITDATATGKAVMKAASAAAGRSALGAAAATDVAAAAEAAAAAQAAASNAVRTDTASQGLTDTQKANARANIGALTSGDVTGVYVWRYTAGAWPTLPSTQPAGVQLVWAVGPTVPDSGSLPAWVGLSAGLVPLLFDTAAVS